jgi:hypothetical protein
MTRAAMVIDKVRRRCALNSFSNPIK